MGVAKQAGSRKARAAGPRRPTDPRLQVIQCGGLQSRGVIGPITPLAPRPRRVTGSPALSSSQTLDPRPWIASKLRGSASRTGPGDSKPRRSPNGVGPPPLTCLRARRPDTRRGGRWPLRRRSLRPRCLGTSRRRTKPLHRTSSCCRIRRSGGCEKGNASTIRRTTPTRLPPRRCIPSRGHSRRADAGAADVHGRVGSSRCRLESP